MVRNSRFFGTGQSGVYSNICFIYLFSNRGMELLPMVRNGTDFFGLTNPVLTFFLFFFLQQRYGAASHGQKWSRFFWTDQPGGPEPHPELPWCQEVLGLQVDPV